MKGFILRLMIGCLVLSLGSICMFSQPLPEFSLDDHPTGPPLNGPWIFPFMSAEDEFGLGLPASIAGFVGPSPSLLMSPIAPLFDSDVLTSFNPPGAPPGHVFLTGFVPPPPMGAPFYMDAVSTNNAPMSGCITIFIEFSIDRATGGINPATDATWNQANLNEQPGDIFRIDTPGFAHLGLFVPLPPPFPPGMPPGPPPWFPWTFYCGGMVNPANGFTNPPYLQPGPAGMGGGGNNFVLYDHSNHLGLLPARAPYPRIKPGTHDNIDAYSRWLFSLLAPGNTDIYFCLHPASAAMWGFSGADIFNCPQPGGLFWPTGIYAPAGTMGLDLVGGPNSDSIDGVAVFDMNIPGVLEPGVDYAGFTLAPGSATLTALSAMGFSVSAATIFMTDFQGYFYVYLTPGDIGVGNAPSPPLPGIPFVDINVDALELTIDPAPLPYTNPITKPIIDPVIRK